jgi:hypothetical protein
MNVRLSQAIFSINSIFIAENKRKEIYRLLWLGFISMSDGWVSACLGCKNDMEIPSIMYEFFVADVKSGAYDVMPTSDPTAVS